MKTISRRGFTLVELMVTISIIGVLSAVVMANLNSARLSGRDAQRKSDLTNLKAAIEMYRQRNGVYPDPGACTDANADAFISEKECAANPYIAGLEPAFISRLPHDPNIRTYDGYAYTTNAARTVFKIMAIRTVEKGDVTDTSDLKRCDTSGICAAYDDGAAEACSPDNAVYKRSFALWGGFAGGGTDTVVKDATALIICK